MISQSLNVGFCSLVFMFFVRLPMGCVFGSVLLLSRETYLCFSFGYNDNLLVMQVLMNLLLVKNCDFLMPDGFSIETIKTDYLFLTRHTLAGLETY